jgi:poly-gamma-glutamate capsule biosynthesis protein CapA/YwtB (metallophosphatase superfamily)
MQRLRVRPKKRIAIAFVVFLVVAAVIGCAAFLGNLPKKLPVKKPTSIMSTPKQTKLQKIRLIASGDMLAHDSINQQAQTANGYDYAPYFMHVKGIFASADIRFCNQEIPTAAPEAGAVDGYPSFNAPRQFAADLSKVGCDVVNVATNHANDKGQLGINATRNLWDTLDKKALAGANRSAEEQRSVQYFNVKGVKFAFLAYNYESNNKALTPYGVNMFDESLMKAQLSEARANGAYILVSVHWGTEDSPNIDATQQKWGQFLADNGADVVIGTGPHVIGPVKKLAKLGGGETLVWYSLGNMLSTQLKIEELIGGFAVMDYAIKGGNPQLESIGFLPSYMHYEWTAQQKANEDLLARKNIVLYPLDQAASPLSRSLHGTSVEQQRQRIEGILKSGGVPVTMLTPQSYEVGL